MPVTEWRLFDGPAPEWTGPEWHAGRGRAAHLEDPAHRPRLLLAASHILGLAAGGTEPVVDLGAGDGGLLSLIDPAVDCWGYDLCPANITGAVVRGVRVYLADVTAGEIDWAPVVVLTEVLEHLADPHALLAQAAANGRAVVASSPAGETPARHYEFHAWAWDPDGYAAMFAAAGFKVADHRVAGPAQVLVGIR